MDSPRDGTYRAETKARSFWLCPMFTTWLVRSKYSVEKEGWSYLGTKFPQSIINLLRRSQSPRLMCDCVALHMRKCMTDFFPYRAESDQFLPPIVREPLFPGLCIVDTKEVGTRYKPRSITKSRASMQAQFLLTLALVMQFSTTRQIAI